MEKNYKKMQWEKPKLNDFDEIKSTSGSCQVGSSADLSCMSGTNASDLCRTGTGASGCDVGNSASNLCTGGSGKGILNPFKK